jgi:imidazolonepropionase-like amidohydrolase
VALAHVTVIDVTGGPARRDVTVVVRGGRIVAVGPASQVRLPPGVTPIDMNGKYVIPGLCDTHVHSEDMEQIYPPLYLANGVTTVREMSGYPYLQAWRERVETGDLFGPRFVVGSAIIDGHPSLWAGVPLPHFEVKDADEARQAVRQVHRDGADFVKVYTRLTRETFQAAADEARRLGIPLVGHCPDLVPVTEASDAGLGSVEHVFNSWYATSSREDEIRRVIAGMVPDGYNDWFHKSLPLDWMAAHSYDPAKAARVFARLARNGCRQVPTLTMHRVLGIPDSVDFSDPRLAYLPQATLEYWKWVLDEMYVGVRTPQESEQHGELVAHRGRYVDRMRRAGVPVMAGTETGTPFCYPGFAMHDEMAELVAAGFTPMQALRAATLEPARFLGFERWLGTVEPGKVADLVVLDANPVHDIRNTQKIHAVLVRGELISAERRRRMLSEVRAAARSWTGEVARAGCACTGAPATARIGGQS